MCLQGSVNKILYHRVFWIGGPHERSDNDSLRNVQFHAGDKDHVKAGEDLSKPIICACGTEGRDPSHTLFVSRVSVLTDKP